MRMYHIIVQVSSLSFIWCDFFKALVQSNVYPVIIFAVFSKLAEVGLASPTQMIRVEKKGQMRMPARLYAVTDTSL